MNEETPNQPEQPEQETQLGPTPLLSPSDPLSPAPLNALAETVAAKADASALAPITAALSALGNVPEGTNNLLVCTGTYTGDGTCGSSRQKTLTVPFYPMLAVIDQTNDTLSPLWLLRGCAYGEATAEGYRSVVTWLDNGVRWYADSTTQQKTRYGVTYRYIIFGCAL